MSLNTAEEYLVQADPLLGAVITTNGHLPARQKRANYEALVRSIISQQISVKAAAKIFARYLEATNLQPERALELHDEALAEVGLSGQKRRYLHDLALHFVENPAVFDHLENLNDDEVVTELTRVKGIGVWTAQMFLMMTLQRPDVFAPGDRGLQLAVMNIYGLVATPSEKDLLEIAEKWRPHRSTASLHLWHSLNNMP
ncbi:MAG: DNA-3-methyladenine glycosylase 2 family protein [bacterium]|nr:DNA-3-methyladenine glycosylase 2 family protein [bacterium]